MKIIQLKLIFIFSVFLLLSLSSCMKVSKPEEQAASSKNLSTQALGENERKELLAFLKAYASSIGAKDSRKIRSFLGADLQKMWGDKAIQNLASTKPINPDEIMLLEAYSKNNFWIFKWRLISSESTDLPWYFLSRDSSRSTLIEAVNFDYDPFSSDR